MNIFIYDQTFEGLLTAIYDALERGITPDKIVSTKSFQYDMFSLKHYITADTEKFEKIWNQVKEKTNNDNCHRIFKAYLFESSDIELVIYNYIKLIIETNYNVELDFSNENVVKITNVQKKVGREAQRVIMFVRFQKTIDDIYYASFNPKYNVIPLTVGHFRSRFADQKWVIFDTKRKYGYYYDLENVREITIGNQKVNFESGKVNNDVLHVSEKLFQKLWKSYYDTINIKERKNLKVHMQFLPKRFWSLLPEKDFNNNIVLNRN